MKQIAISNYFIDTHLFIYIMIQTNQQEYIINYLSQVKSYKYNYYYSMYTNIAKIRQRYNYQSQQPILEEQNHLIYKATDTITEKIVLLIDYNLMYKDSQQIQKKKQQLEQLISQFKKLKQIEHRNISSVYNIIRIDQKRVFFVIEYCQNGSLINYMKKQRFLDQKLAVYIIKQTILGLIELHRNDIVHGFINLENIQIDSKGTWKLSTKCLILKSFYLAPEFKLQGHKQKQGDIFSLGIAFYKMMLGVFPYSGKNDDEILENIQRKKIRGQNIISNLLPFQIVISKKIKNLILKMIQYNLKDRPRGQEIFNKLCDIEKQQSINKYIKWLQEIKSKYLIFNMIQRIDHMKYYSELFFTGIQKQQKQLVKIKFIQINSTKQDVEAIENYKKKLNFFKKDRTNQNFVFIKQSIIHKSNIIIVYQYFNQNTLIRYVQTQKKEQLIHFLEQNQCEQIGYYIQSAIKSYLQTCDAHTWITQNHIYIKQGKLLLAQPFIQLQGIIKKYFEMKDMIDFLSPQKKINKIIKTKNRLVDYWSLGVIVYKLLFNQFPQFNSKNILLFPDNRKISLDLKRKLSLCLNLNQQQREQIRFSIPNIEKIMKYFDLNRQSAKKLIDAHLNSQQPRIIQKDKLSLIQIQNEQQFIKIKSNRSKVGRSRKNLKNDNIQQQSKVDEEQCFQSTCLYIGDCISLTILQKLNYFHLLNQSPNRKIRYGLQILISFIFQILCFYLLFFQVATKFLSDSNNFKNTTIIMRQSPQDSYPNINITIVTDNVDYFANYYNRTLTNITVDLNCVQDSYKNVGMYGNQIYVNQVIKTSGFQAYLIFGIIFLILNLTIKTIQIYELDFIKFMCQISKSKISKYSKILSFLFIELALSSAISIHYILYSSVYFISLQPCITNPQYNSLQKLFQGSQGTFILIYLWQYLGLLLCYSIIIYFVFFFKNKDLENYVWIILLLLYIAGVATRGLAGYTSDNPYFKLVSIFGLCGQLLELLTLASCGMIHYLFWKGINKNQKTKTIQNIRQIMNESNMTIQNNIITQL